MKKLLIIGGTFVGCAAAFVASYLFVLKAPTKPDQAPQRPAVEVAALRTKAEAGDPQAQAQLGDLYLKGEAVTNSYVEAAKWFRLSAEKNNAEGKLGLGQLYEAGQGGVPRDQAQAVKLYREAADQGLAGAQYTMGFLYEAGRGVPANQPEATKWYLKAAEQGEPLAQFDLAQRYEIGVGASIDKVEALKWYILAARQGQPDSAKRGASLKKQISRVEAEEAQRRADAFVPKAQAASPR
jgi:TPR repeat protein